MAILMAIFLLMLEANMIRKYRKISYCNFAHPHNDSSIRICIHKSLLLHVFKNMLSAEFACKYS